MVNDIKYENYKVSVMKINNIISSKSFQNEQDNCKLNHRQEKIYEVTYTIDCNNHKEVYTDYIRYTQDIGINSPNNYLYYSYNCDTKDIIFANVHEKHNTHFEIIINCFSGIVYLLIAFVIVYLCFCSCK